MPRFLSVFSLAPVEATVRSKTFATEEPCVP